MAVQAKSIILVPANYGIEPECERGLVQLERRGYAVWDEIKGTGVFFLTPGSSVC
jgi:hypothetical protein